MLRINPARADATRRPHLGTRCPCAPTPRPTYCQPDDRMCWLRARRRTLRLAESTSRRRRPSGLRGAFPASFRSPRPDVSDGRSDGRTRGADHLASSPSLSSTALPLPPPDGGSASAERARLDVRRWSADPAGSGSKRNAWATADASPNRACMDLIRAVKAAGAAAGGCRSDGHSAASLPRPQVYQ